MIAVHWNFEAEALCIRAVSDASQELGELQSLCNEVELVNALFTVDTAKLETWRAGQQEPGKQFAEVRGDILRTPLGEVRSLTEIFMKPRQHSHFHTADGQAVEAADYVLIRGKNMYASGCVLK